MAAIRGVVHIAETLAQVLQPRGLTVIVQASHECLLSRGVRLHGASMQTRRLPGEFAREPRRQEIMATLAG